MITLLAYFKSADENLGSTSISSAMQQLHIHQGNKKLINFLQENFQLIHLKHLILFLEELSMGSRVKACNNIYKKSQKT